MKSFIKTRGVIMILPFYLFIFLPFLMASCEREPALYLPYESDNTGPVRIAVDWTNFLRKETPSGMTLMLFRQNDSLTTKAAKASPYGFTLISSETTNNIAYSDFTLPPADYAAYVFNQSESEFGTLAFHSLSDYNNAEVTASHRTSSWYTADKAKMAMRAEGVPVDSVEPLINSVEWLGTAAHDSIPLTKAMLDSAGGMRLTIDTLHAINVVYTVTVYVHIQNIGSLSGARASLQGLAHGYMLGQHHPSPDKATELIERWSLNIDSTVTDSTGKNVKYGTIAAQISTLGLPYGHMGTPPENIVHLECRLKNDSVITNNYKVGDKFEFDENDNAELHFTLHIYMQDPLPDTPDEPDDNPSAFDVTVEDWGDEGGIPLPI